jgi:signal transduction histidine kinase
VVPSLFVIRGVDQGKRFDIAEDVTGLGRDANNDIQLHDTEVSRRHAEIRLDELDDSFVLVDLDSSNGTYVNNRRVGQQALRNGDRVQLGRTLMIFTGQEDGTIEDVLEHVDISSRPPEASRIVKSLANDPDEPLLTRGAADNRWLARARSNLQVMYRTALAVSHTMEIDQLLARIMDLIFEWVEADRGCVLLTDPDSRELVPKVRRNRPGIRPGEKMSISRTILDYVLQRSEGVLTSDAREDERWDAAGSIVKLGVREAICVPMQGRYGVVGIIYIDTYTPPGLLIQQGNANKFNEEHLKLMIAIGHQAALAVEDTSYYSAMVQAERLAAIGQTIAGLSHHVKNILQGIQGGSYLIEEGLNSAQPDVVRKGWRIVEKNQEKISRLVLDMLTFSKERRPDIVAADLNQVIQEIVDLMRARAAERGSNILWTPDPDMPRLSFDPDGMHHAILNVVTNAIDACEDCHDGRIAISAEYSADEQVARVAVTDNGKGIAADELQNIFNFFVSSKGIRGTGLGLSVSQKIVQEHGGKILVASTVDQGSTFTIEIPAVLADATASGLHRSTVAENARGQDDVQPANR